MNKLTPFILIILALGLFFMYIEPTYSDDVAVLHNQRDQYDTALSTAQRISFRLDELTTQYNSFAPEDLDRLEKLLPESIDEIRLLMDVNDIAVSRGIVLSEIAIADGSGAGESEVSGAEALGGEPGFETNVRPRSVGAEVQTTQITFSVTAAYPDFIEFLHDLEKSLRVIDVTTVGIGTSEGPGSSGGNSSEEDGEEVSDVYTFEVNVDTYWIENRE